MEQLAQGTLFSTDVNSNEFQRQRAAFITYMPLLDPHVQLFHKIGPGSIGEITLNYPHRTNALWPSPLVHQAAPYLLFYVSSAGDFTSGLLTGWTLHFQLRISLPISSERF